MGATLQIKDLSLRYPTQKEFALRPLNLSVADGEILSLIGPSGSGKTSLLHLIAGLSRPTEGCIHINAQCIADTATCLPPELRPIGLVSQGGDLFPHLTVAKNIAYGLTKWPRNKRKKRVTELLEAIELPAYRNRYPAELSGGEAQRVALARSLAPRPEILLLDEPFSSLDRALRERLRALTRTLLKDSGTTAIFVTHHTDDARHMGDRTVSLLERQIVK